MLQLFIEIQSLISFIQTLHFMSKELVGPETKESNDTEEGRRAAIVDPIERIPAPGMKNQIRVFNPHILMEHHGIKDKGRLRSSTNPTRFSLTNVSTIVPSCIIALAPIGDCGTH